MDAFKIVANGRRYVLFARPTIGGMAWFLHRASRTNRVVVKKIFNGGPESYKGVEIINVSGTEPAERQSCH